MNPFERADQIKKHVCKNQEKKYFRFRATKFYGGVATADCVGCNLSCAFCWNYRRNQQFKEIGDFYSPAEVANKLIEIAEENDFSKVRITGGEPTIGREHLLKLLKEIPEDLLFILETNGILIGKDRSYAEDLSQRRNLHVRVSLKGVTKEEFSKLTKADEKFYNLQFKVLKNLKDQNVSYHASVMTMKDSLKNLRRRLSRIDSSMRLEKEKMKMYPPVKERMQEEGLV